MLNIRHNFLTSIQSIFALKKNFRSTQVTQEVQLGVYRSLQFDRRNVNQCINTSMYRYTPVKIVSFKCRNTFEQFLLNALCLILHHLPVQCIYSLYRYEIGSDQKPKVDDSAGQWCSAGYTQVYGVYPHFFRSAMCIHASKSPLILSVLNQLFRKTVYRRNYQTTWKVFLCVDGLRNKE